VDGCAYIEKSTSACIYINRMAQDVDTLLLVNSDMASDPTLQHTSGRMEACPECDHDDAVFFQTLANRDVSGMRLYFVCSNRSCGHAWVSKAYGMKDPALAEVEE
jgi:DNA-directed RNA polymerase II subunit RPB9